MFVTVHARKTRICLFGSLLKGKEDFSDGHTDLMLKTPSPLVSILEGLGIPYEKIQIVFVNHRAVFRDHIVHPGDRVSLFPREYAFFPDWKKFRF